MPMPKRWTECHEEVSRDGRAEPCDARPVVGLRVDPEDREWYPVCTDHVRADMADLWRVVFWAGGEAVPSDVEAHLIPETTEGTT